MFGLDLKSIVIAALVGVIAGWAACSGAHFLWLDQGLVDRTTASVAKSVTEVRDAVCAQTVSDATAIATKAAADRAQRNADAALQSFAAEAAARAERDSRQIEHLQQEAKGYEEKLAADGRADPLTLDDIIWLRGHGFTTKPGTP